MTANEIYTAILSGEADGEFEGIMLAIQERKKSLGAMTFASLREGDRVRVNAPNIKPRYIHGATGILVEKRVTKVTVRFDDDINDPYDKWAGARCILSPTMVEKIED